MSYENKRKETLQIFLKSLFKYPPQGLDCVTYSYAIVCSILIFPLNSPLAKGGGFARVRARITYKKGRPSDLPFQYPLRGSTALLAVGSRVLESLHPPNLPEREATQGSSPVMRIKTKNPMEKPSDLLLYPLRGSNPGPQH